MTRPADVLHMQFAFRELTAKVPPYVDGYVFEPISAALCGQKRLTCGLRVNIVREGLPWGEPEPSIPVSPWANMAIDPTAPEELKKWLRWKTVGYQWLR